MRQLVRIPPSGSFGTQMTCQKLWPMLFSRHTRTAGTCILHQTSNHQVCDTKSQEPAQSLASLALKRYLSTTSYRNADSSKSQQSGSSSVGKPFEGGQVPGSKMPESPGEMSAADVERFMTALPFDQIPGPPIVQSIPYAGTWLLYFPFTDQKPDDMGQMFSKLQTTYGPITRVKIGSEWLVLIDNLRDVERVVRAAELEDVVKSQRGTRLEAPRLSNQGILTDGIHDSALSWLDGTSNFKLRNTVAEAFDNKKLAVIFWQNQQKVADEFLQCLNRGYCSAEELQNLCYRYALESSAYCCYNERLGLLQDNFHTDGEKKRIVESYRTLVQSLGESLTGTRILHLLFEDPFTKRFNEAKRVVSGLEQQLLRQFTVSHARENQTKSKSSAETACLLEALLSNTNLSEQHINDTLHAFMTFGSDMAASCLQMLLYSLSVNYEKQGKVSDEIKQVCGPEGNMTFDQQNDLKFTGACLKESLRLNFPVPGGGRVTLSNNIVLNNYLIPAGTQIMVNSRKMAKNPVWFDHPHFFLPERWLAPESRDVPSLAFLPFGFGPNRVPSRLFVTHELIHAVVKVLSQFKLDLPGEYQQGKLDTAYTPFRTPKEPFPFIITPIHGGSLRRLPSISAPKKTPELSQTAPIKPKSPSTNKPQQSYTSQFSSLFSSGKQETEPAKPEKSPPSSLSQFRGTGGKSKSDSLSTKK